MDISLPIPEGTTSLENCLAEFGKFESLETPRYCANCPSRGAATKKIQISKLPDILVIRKRIVSKTLLTNKYVRFKTL